MAKKSILRLVAAPLLLAVFILGVQVAAHFDGNSHDEAHCTCQICHIAHAAIPQPAARTQLQRPSHIARFAPSEQVSLAVEPGYVLSIPRAPPA